MITGNQLEVLVALVLGLDAVVIAGIVISRLTHRRSKRQEAASSVALAESPSAERGSPYPERGLVDTSGSAVEMVAPAGAAALAEAPPSAAEVGAVFADAPFAEAPVSDALVSDAPDTSAEAEYAAFDELAPPPAEPDGSSGEELPVLVDGREPGEAPGLSQSPRPSPVGLDFGPTWVDPLEMAATAAAEWRHTLRRDLARAAYRGRSAMVMHLKLDIDSRPDLPIQEVARLEGLLLDTMNTVIRSGDHVDRTGPGRFHMILSEMPEAGAVAVVERIRHVFAGNAPVGPRLLIGWAAMEREADIVLALQRAAERVSDGGSDLPEGPLGP